jgi:hypothetical protein
MKTARLALVLTAVLAALPFGSGAVAATSATYSAPYEAGPTGPPSSVDPWNVIMADPAAGSILLARAYPVPGTFSCAGAGPYANFVVRHSVTDAVNSVTVNYANALIDNFTFLRVALTDVAPDGTATQIGFREIQGPIVALAGSTDLTMGTSQFWQAPAVGDTLVVTFGLNESSACLPAQPADAGTISFPSVSVA